MPLRDDNLWDDGSGNPELWLAQLVVGNSTYCVRLEGDDNERRGVWILTSELS